jgi:hypothetical protein
MSVATTPSEERRWSPQKLRAVRRLRWYQRHRETLDTKHAAAVGGAELLRWRQLGAELPRPALTLAALERAELWPEMERATPNVQRALLQFLQLVVACWMDGGRPLVATWESLAELLDASPRTLRWWCRRLMAAGLGALLVDARFVESDGRLSYKHSQQPNLFAPGMALRCAIRESALPIASRAQAELGGWVVALRNRFNGVIPLVGVKNVASPPDPDPDLPLYVSTESDKAGNVRTPVDRRGGVPFGDGPAAAGRLNEGGGASDEETPAAADAGGAEEGAASASPATGEDAAAAAPAGAGAAEAEGGGGAARPQAARDPGAAQRAVPSPRVQLELSIAPPAPWEGPPEECRRVLERLKKGGGGRG